MEILRERGGGVLKAKSFKGYMYEAKLEFPEGVGGSNQRTSMEGVWIFPGTTTVHEILKISLGMCLQDTMFLIYFLLKTNTQSLFQTKIKGFCHGRLADFWPKLPEISGSELNPFRTLSLNI